MQTLYRIIDTSDYTIVAEGMHLRQAEETLKFYTLDNTHSEFEIEKYTKQCKPDKTH